MVHDTKDSKNSLNIPVLITCHWNLFMGVVATDFVFWFFFFWRNHIGMAHHQIFWNIGQFPVSNLFLWVKFHIVVKCFWKKEYYVTRSFFKSLKRKKLDQICYRIFPSMPPVLSGRVLVLLVSLVMRTNRTPQNGCVFISKFTSFISIAPGCNFSWPNIVIFWLKIGKILKFSFLE